MAKSKIGWLSLVVGGACLSGCGGSGTGPTPPPASQEQVVFSSNRDGNSEIYTMNIDGTNQRRLTNDPAFDTSPALNAKTNRIAFESNRDEINGDIYLMGADGQGTRLLAGSPGADSDPAFSRDGSKVVFSSTRRDSGLYIVNADGSNLTPIKPGKVGLRTLGPFIGDPTFHPNGRSIAFVDSPADASGGTMYAVNIDSSGVKQLGPDDASDNSPSFSPDGRKIVFSRVLFENGVQNSEIFTMNVDGTNPIRLTRSIGSDGSPTFTADGRKIVFSSRRDGNGEIYIMNVDGTNPTRLTNNAAEDDLPSTS